MSYKGLNMHAQKSIQGIHISFVACVIPCFGIYMQFTLGGVKKEIYISFNKDN